jgi:CheY-like chemotaxis protein
LEGLHVLVAEDNPVNRTLIDCMLKNLGVRVTLLNNGSKVTVVLAHQDIDPVLMDLQMPTMDGFEATTRVRHLPSPLGDVPIVALTASALVQGRQRRLNAGMDDHITKPIDPKVLEQTLIRWSRQRIQRQAL